MQNIIFPANNEFSITFWIKFNSISYSTSYKYIYRIFNDDTENYTIIEFRVMSLFLKNSNINIIHTGIKKNLIIHIIQIQSLYAKTNYIL